MSLATRCPVCQTVFRVVQDQLKVSEGWVRCGRCAKVFNAFEGLFDLEREFPALRSPTPSQKVLEDLATRNRQPKQPSDWPDDFDTGSGTRAVSQPASPATSRTASPATVPHVSVPRAPAPAPVPSPTPPSPVVPPVPAPSVAVPAPSIGAAPREPTPFVSRTPRAPVAADKDDAATIPPASVVAAAKPAPRGDADRQATVVRGPRRASQRAAVAAAAPAPQPAPPARSAARAAAEIAIRDEPAPVPGTADEADARRIVRGAVSQRRRDGAARRPRRRRRHHARRSDVEPAALDDAVDSRLLTFVQQADRAERWRRPWVRAAMALSALALTALLAAQLLVAQRDAVVAQWPGMRSLVQSLCAPLDCRIEPLRRIEQLGVDSSGLTRIDDGPVYRLALVLRNRSDMPLLMPSIDLSLSDAAGVLVSRRTLSATDLGTVRNTIGAGPGVAVAGLADVGRAPADRLHDRDLLPLIRHPWESTCPS